MLIRSPKAGWDRPGHVEIHTIQGAIMPSAPQHVPSVLRPVPYNRYGYDSPQAVKEYWDAAMVEAERCGAFTHTDRANAGNWALCAVGACGSAVAFVEFSPRPGWFELRPADDRLNELGRMFSNAVNRDHVKAAKKHREAIIARIHELTEKQHDA